MYSIHFQSNMKSIILVLALCVCASFAYEFEEYTWEGFKKIHKRTYVGIEERMREKIFLDNLKEIEDFNAEDHSYKLGVNQFTDLVSICIMQSTGFQKILLLNFSRCCQNFLLFH